MIQGIITTMILTYILKFLLQNYHKMFKLFIINLILIESLKIYIEWKLGIKSHI